MKEILLAWLPTVPAYFLGIYQFRFMLTPRPGVGYRLLFVVYGLVLLGAKSFSDFYWQITGTGQGLSCLVVCLMVLTLPLFLLLCFGGDWRRRLFVLFPAVCLHSFVVSPFCLLVMNQPWPLPYYSRWLGISALFFLGSLAACAISCLLCLPLIRMAEALPRPLYTALAVASPLLNMGINLQQVLFLLKNPNRLYGMLRHLPFLMLESIAIGFVFLWLVNRYARQTLAIAAAREQMHRHALEAQQRSVEQLRALRAGNGAPDDAAGCPGHSPLCGQPGGRCCPGRCRPPLCRGRGHPADPRHAAPQLHPAAGGPGQPAVQPVQQRGQCSHPGAPASPPFH